jgi:hypothetical protein
MSLLTDLFNPRNLVDSIWCNTLLPDARLNPRLCKNVEMLIERLEAPAYSVPRKLMVGAQRFWNNDRVKPESLTAPMLAHQAKLLTGPVADHRPRHDGD